MADSQYKRYVLIVAVLTAFAGSLTINAVIVAIPAIGDELTMTAVQLGWIAQSFALAADSCAVTALQPCS